MNSVFKTKVWRYKLSYCFQELYASKYAFGYHIKDTGEGNDYGHEEKRNGKYVEGEYHVLLPDGRIQKVEYYADKSGYHAKVKYEKLLGSS